MQKISAGKFHGEPPFTSFDHLVGAAIALAELLRRTLFRLRRKNYEDADVREHIQTFTPSSIAVV
jgi:hypothetical protein